jgi:drug/metabolite transporter (DMT)-like permease
MKLKAHAIILIGNFFFGCSVIAIKQLAPTFMPALAINVVRILTALVLFWILFLFKKDKTKVIEKEDWPRLIACAFTGIIINQILFVKGTSITSPIHASLLGLSTPIVIMILGFLLNKESIKPNLIVGLLLGIIGATILIFLKTKSDKESTILGDVLIILNATSYATYLIIAKPLIKKYSPITIIRWAFTIGAVIIVPFGWKDFTSVNFNAVLQIHQNIWALIFICVGATFISYLCIMHGIAKMGSQVVGSYIYTQPIFATIAAMMLFKEPLNATKIIAALLIFGGVYLVNATKK